MCVIECLNNLFKLIPGLEDENPTFSRSLLINQSESIQTVLQTGTVLPKEYVVNKILTILGDGDKAEEIIKALREEEAERMLMIKKAQEQDSNEAEETANNKEETERDVARYNNES